MSKYQHIRRQVCEIAEGVCEGAGYELVDVEVATTQGRGLTVRVFVECADHDQAVGFDDCERISRELSAVLDVEDPIPGAYNLEVSSPGVERPLRTASHFNRFLGQEARIKMSAGVGGRRNFKGTLVHSDDQQITIHVDGADYRLPLGDISSARLVPDWDELMGRNKAVGK